MIRLSDHDVEPQAPDASQEPTARRVFRECVTEVAEKARQALPQSHGRIESAVKLVLAGDVELAADGKSARVASGTTPGKWYQVNGVCQCVDSERAPEQQCKHRLAFGLHKRASTLAKERLEDAQTKRGPEEQVPLEVSAAPAQASGIPSQFIQLIHGKPFVRYAGLLALAHERGLTSLKTRFTSVTDTLALAEAEATFADGRVFVESADATASNVTATVKAHFPRVACTRAAARALRNALNIELCAVEELE